MLNRCKVMPNKLYIFLLMYNGFVCDQMETVIKQTEESMTRKLSAASRLHEDYRPLKAEVDLLRRQCLGLERLPDLHEEEGSPITPEYVSCVHPPLLYVLLVYLIIYCFRHVSLSLSSGYTHHCGHHMRPIKKISLIYCTGAFRLSLL